MVVPRQVFLVAQGSNGKITVADFRQIVINPVEVIAMNQEPTTADLNQLFQTAISACEKVRQDMVSGNTVSQKELEAAASTALDELQSRLITEFGTQKIQFTNFLQAAVAASDLTILGDLRTLLKSLQRYFAHHQKTVSH